ncbi:MAG: YggT family protein [Treponema sp.]|jgi:YggT family protein|nr:YggT family protein [Treponema sp.]
MQMIMNILAALTGLYMLMIFIRIMFSWLGVSREGQILVLLGRLTDPYLDWWRARLPMRTGTVDFSPIAAMTVLSVVHTVFSTAARSGSIRVGTVLAIALSALWSAAAFLLGFFIIVLILRFIAYMTGRSSRGVFWNFTDMISRPVLYRVNRFFFRDRIVNYLSGIVCSLLVLIVLYAAGRFLTFLAVRFLVRLPL